ncbi:MAG: hypothetical protein IT361_04810 [Gemmatimonadaceae bacterium]|nr:hypothetical protein [Gemmatimonadaceae bacterium]
MSAATAAGAILLTGSPTNLTAVVPFDAGAERSVPVSLTVEGASTIYRGALRPHGRGQSEVRLRLPADTPPGRYDGEATFDGKPRRVYVEVEPVVRVRVQPKQSVVSGAAGTSVSLALNVVNSGNTGVEIPQIDAFDLDDASGQDRALGRALRAQLASGESRVERFFDEMRADHGGEARVSVKRGSGLLAPGESRELSANVELPDTLNAGRTYEGSWLIGNDAHLIVVTVPVASRPRNGRTKP